MFLRLESKEMDKWKRTRDVFLKALFHLQHLKNAACKSETQTIQKDVAHVYIERQLKSAQWNTKNTFCALGILCQ